MIPNLLWRCPLCKTNDALKQKNRLFGAMLVACSNCGTSWRAKRVIGDDFQLQVLNSPAYPAEEGLNLPLATWYDRMKATVSLEPISDPGFSPEPGERLFLASWRTTLVVLPNDPIAAELDQKARKRPAIDTGIKVGVGRLYLTDRRLTWIGSEDQRHDFPLTRVNSAFIAGNFTLMVLYDLRILDFRFKRESLLKWLTFISHVGKLIQETEGHRITTSKF